MRARLLRVMMALAAIAAMGVASGAPPQKADPGATKDAGAASSAVAPKPKDAKAGTGKEAGAGTPNGAAPQDPKAIEVAAAVEKAMAPEGGFKSVAVFKFSVTVLKNNIPEADRTYIWDVTSGRVRMEGKKGLGSERVMFFNAETGKGEVYVNVTQVPSESDAPTLSGWVHPPGLAQRNIVKLGHDRFVKDMLWLLLPLKMRDPGTKLEYQGVKAVADKKYDVVKLTFGSLRRTDSEDYSYTFYVNQKTQLIDRWDVAPRNASQKAEKESEVPDDGLSSAAESRTGTWLWQEWKKFGPLRLSTERNTPDGSASIVFKDVEVLSKVPEGTFDPPAGARKGGKKADRGPGAARPGNGVAPTIPPSNPPAPGATPAPANPHSTANPPPTPNPAPPVNQKPTANQEPAANQKPAANSAPPAAQR